MTEVPSLALVQRRCAHYVRNRISFCAGLCLHLRTVISGRSLRRSKALRRSLKWRVTYRIGFHNYTVTKFENLSGSPRHENSFDACLLTSNNDPFFHQICSCFLPSYSNVANSCSDHILKYLKYLLKFCSNHKRLIYIAQFVVLCF